MTSCEVIENKAITVGEMVKDFKSESLSVSLSSRLSYKKAITSLELYVAGRFSSSEPLTTTIVEGWFINLIRQGVSLKTAGFYLDILSALQAAAFKSFPNLFKNFKTKLRNFNTGNLTGINVRSIIESFLNLIHNPKNRNESDRLSLDIILFSLAEGLFSLRDIAALKKENIDSLSVPAKEITLRHISPKRKYIFPLRQTEFTPSQREENLNKSLSAFLAKENFPVSGNLSDILKLLWLAMAFSCGFTPQVIRGFIDKSPVGFKILDLCSPESIQSAQRKLIALEVALRFSGESKKWFAMQLRPGVSYENMLSRYTLLENKHELKDYELFCPCEEISKRVGRKFVWEEKPLLGNIIFFRSHPSEVYPLFRKIWQYAWCYRDNGLPGRPYAVIPNRDMEIFQKTIGQFTPEFEVKPSGELTLRPGDKVVIIGGAYAEKIADVIKIDTKKSDAAGTVYRVSLSDTVGNWNIGIDARLLRKL